MHLQLHLVGAIETRARLHVERSASLHPEAVIDEVGALGSESGVGAYHLATQHRGILSACSKDDLLSYSALEEELQRVAHLERLILAARVYGHLHKHIHAVAPSDGQVVEGVARQSVYIDPVERSLSARKCGMGDA